MKLRHAQHQISYLVLSRNHHDSPTVLLSKKFLYKPVNTTVLFIIHSETQIKDSVYHTPYRGPTPVWTALIQLAHDRLCKGCELVFKVP